MVLSLSAALLGEWWWRRRVAGACYSGWPNGPSGKLTYHLPLYARSREADGRLLRALRSDLCSCFRLRRTAAALSAQTNEDLRARLS